MKMFFFSIREKEDKIVVGNGSDNDHFNVCMTSYALLCNSDGSNQNHVTCTGIDATYKIFREKFNLVAYGRTDLKRTYHPI